MLDMVKKRTAKLKRKYKKKRRDRRIRGKERKGESWYFRFYIKKNFSIEEGKVCEMEGTVS